MIGWLEPAIGDFMRLLRVGLLGIVALLFTCSAAVAQTAAPQRGKLVVTVADPSGAIIPGATVTLLGLETATKATPTPPAKSDEKGIVTFERVVPGRYSIQGAFPGFEMGLMRDVRVKAGDNKQLLILPLKQMSESVTVGGDSRTVASTRPTLGTALTREQIEALSDDPDELQRQIAEIGGPNARIRVDSFEGSQLPPKAQIKAIHITRDQYSAENHFIGGIFVDIVTQPGIGPVRVNMGTNYTGSQLSDHTALTPKKGPEQRRAFNGNIGGTIAKQKADFSIGINGMNSYGTPSIYVYGPEGRTNETLDIRQPQRQASINGVINYAITRDQTMRAGVFIGGNGQDNLGIGNNNLQDRGFSRRARNRQFRFQEVGPIGRRMFINTRVFYAYNHNWATSVNEAPTIVITDSRTSGGAQQKGGSRSSSVNVQSDLDYIRGIHSFRAGVLVEGTWFRADDSQNYLGTYTFSSVEAFQAGKPLFYSRRIGDPNIKYSNLQAGVYVQDDIRVSKTLTLSPGLRYELQTHVSDHNGFGPRFGATWSPFKSGKTTIRGGGGLFYDWLDVGTYAQTVRIDGFHQQDLTITSPTYPDPGNVGNITATNRYLIGGDYVMPRNAAINIGVDQSLTPRIRVSGGYTFNRSTEVARGNNLNPPVNGVRSDVRFLNVIETVSDAETRSHNVYVSTSFSLVSGPAANQPRFNWKRMSFNAFAQKNRFRSNGTGTFSVPASGTLATEWAPSGSPANFSVGFNSSQVKNVNFGFSMFASAPGYYTITTGIDNNGDQMLNDRPAGVPRNSERIPNWNIGSSARLGYTFTFGKGTSAAPQGIQIIGDRGGAVTVTQVGGGAQSGRYRLSINVNVNNLTNRNNWGGYVGTTTSKLFRQPTSSGEPRRLSVNMNLGF